jgi:hypothetical protein
MILFKIQIVFMQEEMSKDLWKRGKDVKKWRKIERNVCVCVCVCVCVEKKKRE